MQVNRTKTDIDNIYTNNTNDKPDSFVEIKELEEIAKGQSEMKRFLLKAFG